MVQCSLLRPFLTKFHQVSTRGQSDSMSYGWKRMEVVGALTNGIFLVSLCLYIVLEAIPRFIRPPRTDYLHLILASAYYCL